MILLIKRYAVCLFVGGYFAEHTHNFFSYMMCCFVFGVLLAISNDTYQ